MNKVQSRAEGKTPVSIKVDPQIMLQTQRLYKETDGFFEVTEVSCPMCGESIKNPTRTWIINSPTTCPSCRAERIATVRKVSEPLFGGEFFFKVIKKELMVE